MTKKVNLKDRVEHLSDCLDDVSIIFNINLAFSQSQYNKETDVLSPWFNN